MLNLSLCCVWTWVCGVFELEFVCFLKLSLCCVWTCVFGVFELEFVSCLTLRLWCFWTWVCGVGWTWACVVFELEFDVFFNLSWVFGELGLLVFLKLREWNLFNLRIGYWFNLGLCVCLTWVFGVFELEFFVFFNLSLCVFLT